MKKVKVITKNAELEEFLARTDIEITNVDIMSCEQSFFAQEYFTATVYYDDAPKSDYIPDYWTRLEHQYAGMAMQGALNNSLLITGLLKVNKSHEDIVAEVTGTAVRYAHTLVEKLKEKEERK